jgi:hypothetical protein
LTATCPLTGAQTKNTATNGNIGGLGTLNPVQTARWEVVGTGSGGTKIPAQDLNSIDTLPGGGADPNKYDLVRSLVDGNGNLLAETTEVIAEYAVNFDFAFSVDTGDTTGSAPKIVSYDFGDATNQKVADTVNIASPVHGPAYPDPQRVRSARFLLSTRTGLPDRTATIPVPAGGGTGAFLYRYCMTSAGCAGNALMQWARVRTLVGEVSLPNQQQAFY